jgi:hypothetical protein
MFLKISDQDSSRGHASHIQKSREDVWRILIFKGLPRPGLLFAVDLLKAVPGPTSSYYPGADFSGLVPHLFWGLGVLGNYWGAYDDTEGGWIWTMMVQQLNSYHQADYCSFSYERF